VRKKPVDFAAEAGFSGSEIFSGRSFQTTTLKMTGDFLRYRKTLSNRNLKSCTIIDIFFFEQTIDTVQSFVFHLQKKILQRFINTCREMLRKCRKCMNG